MHRVICGRLLASSLTGQKTIAVFDDDLGAFTATQTIRYCGHVPVRTRTVDEALECDVAMLALAHGGLEFLSELRLRGWTGRALAWTGMSRRRAAAHVRGSSFEAIIPKDRFAALRIPALLADRSWSPMVGIVDDSATQLELLLGEVRAAGWDEDVGTWKDLEVDLPSGALLLCDLNLDGTSGTDILQRRPDLNVVILSGSMRAGDITAAFQAGAMDVLGKEELTVDVMALLLRGAQTATAPLLA